jgi:cell division protein FtsA
MAQTPILGLDIGSSLIKAVVAQPSPEGKMVVGLGLVRPSRGLRKGVVVDMDATANAVGGVLQEIKPVVKSALRNIYLRVGAADVRVQSSRGITAVARASSEIYRDDIERVVQASEAINLSSNRMILHTLKQEFIVDGVGEIQDPLGMTGARLEVISLVIDAFEPAVKNLIKCVELAGGSVSGLIFGPIAAGAAVLTNNQKELGVIIIDIGYGTSGIAVYEENKLIHTKVFPIGAGHVTSDLAVALKIPFEVAEKVKLSYGYALAREVSSKEKIDLNKIEANVKGTPSRRFIAEVAESRLREIGELINKELRTIGKERHLPGGAVLVGGGAKMPGIVELIKDELKLSTQIGLPQRALFEPHSSAENEFLESPEYASVLGLTLWSGLSSSGRRLPAGDNVVINFLKRFMP